MRFARFLLFLLLLPVVAAYAQETEPPDGTRIASALVSGIDLDRLSAALQEEIGKLPGTSLNRQALKDLAARIEIEQPRYIAGVRVSNDPDGGARVVFVVARMRDEQREANINNRYVVEEVELRGVPERDLDQALRNDLYALAGRQLDSDEAERLETRLRDALRQYVVRRQTVRGSAPGRVRLIFSASRADWARFLHFEPAELNTIYHSDQGWGMNLPVTIGGRDVRVTPIIAIDIGDELVEEYDGFALRFESRKLGTERLGLFFEWATADQEWRDVTLAAITFDPTLPLPYRNRMTVAPVLKFAITPQLSVGGGVRITELDPFLELPFELRDGQMANAALGSVTFSLRGRPEAVSRHNLESTFTVHAGTRGLESDYVYERYLGHAVYGFRQARHQIRVSGMAGAITGQAPLFERFTLGDSRTLRGWDKYDLAPAGSNRMFHTSLEYEFAGLGWFLDAGSFWNDGTQRRVRFSTGLNFTPGPAFFTIGFPLNTDEFRAVFTMGIRFRGGVTASIGKY